MDDAALRLAIGDLNAAYADCIDDDRLEEWPDFFVEDCRYLITDRASHEAGLRHGIIYAASKGMLADRVVAMRGANIFRRIATATSRPGPHDRSGGWGRGGAHQFFAVRIMHNGDSAFATGRYLDRIDVAQTRSLHRAPRDPRCQKDRHPLVLPL
jgi:hypothetical protein